MSTARTILLRVAWLTAVGTGCTREISYHAYRPELHVAPNPPSLETPSRTDVLHQRIPERIDVLWVIDNSSSMLAEQEKLADTFPVFLRTYRDSGLDWQVGVISTDMDDPTQRGKLQAAAGYLWDDPTVPEPISVFAQMATLGRDGSAREQGRAAIQAALSEPLRSGYNDGFFRDDAKLSVIIVSDERDFSNDEPGLYPFLTWFDTLKPDRSMLEISAITQVDTRCAEQPSADYLALTEATGGVAFSICEDDWTPILEVLGARAAGLGREFFLAEVPVPDTIEVSIEDEEYLFLFEAEVDWTYDAVRNSINFLTYMPRASAEVYIRYDLAAGESR